MLFTKNKHKVDAKRLKKKSIKSISDDELKKMAYGRKANLAIGDENDEVEKNDDEIKKAVYKSSIFLKDADGNVRLFKATIVEDSGDTDTE